MRRVRVPEPTLAAELENVLETVQWVRGQVYRQHGIRKEQISLLRRAIAASGGLSQDKFRKQTRLRADTVSRAASFICHKDREWARSQPGAKDRRVQFIIATPKGLTFVESLDRQVEEAFFATLGVSSDSKRAARIAEVVKKLNHELDDFIRRQASLFE